jgi:biotin carboxyl carrier protein
VTVYLDIAGALRRVEIACDAAGTYTAVLDGENVALDARVLRPGVLSLLLNGRAHRVVLEETGEETAVHVGRQRFEYRVDDPRSLRSRRARTDSADGPRTIKASMPGRVVRVMVAKGDAVAAQQGLLVVEAMKMQNELKSPKDGKVAQLLVQAGETVSAGQALAVVE